MAKLVSDPSSCANFHEVVVKHIDLNWTVDFEKKLLRGTATLTIRAIEKVDKLILDICDQDFKNVSCGEAVLEYKIEPNEVYGQKMEISITTMEPNEERKIRFDYETSSKAGALQFMSKEMTKDKMTDYLYCMSCYTYGRSIIPCMDTPSVKQTLSAKIGVPAEMNCAMSAICKERTTNDLKTNCVFEQPIPIPVYLFAFVVGRIEGRDLSPRCAVWAEPSVVDAAQREFQETEKLLQTAEKMAGPYVWGRYDLVVMPPSFPFGGMENPCLTFVAPSVVVGDRSLVNVVVHEIAHSWTGNLVTNATWEHYWLNEGYTVYLERKLLGKLYTEKTRQFHCIQGWEDKMVPCITDFLGVSNKLTKLVTDLKGEDINEIYSEIPYEKGSAFLIYLEQVFGLERFDEFLKHYVEKFQRQAITTDDWKKCLEEFFSKEESALKSVDFDTWLNGLGIPPNKPDFHYDVMKRSQELAEKWIKGSEEVVESLTLEEFNEMQVYEQMRMLLLLKDIPEERLERLGSLYGLDKTENTRLRFNFLYISLRKRCAFVINNALDFVTECGMVSYLKKIYKELLEWTDSRKAAVQRFEANKPSMHPMAVDAVNGILKQFQI
ncbi:hypothetical protein L596_014564 [Steinernema carpocapsae]|uniref:Peptidase M1 leukotriene A4 hydrolase/aminopeptidase C-terminal domain-containing protein n=1 Tax=Steinernema carpocapsae TaxID=34508 RepID=A0A4U5NCA4_STECR|nr:hypothetical protein L596_014564 [Steinernema carpocapsae]